MAVKEEGRSTPLRGCGRNVSHSLRAAKAEAEKTEGRERREHKQATAEVAARLPAETPTASS